MEVAASDLDNLKATELRLGLPGSDAPEKPAPASPRGSKRALLEANEEHRPGKSKSLEADSRDQEAQPVAKARVVGWPPIRSYRKNSFQARKAEVEAAGLFVKVSMDGAPYLRKIDLKLCKGYQELREALDNMFRCFSIGELSGMEGCDGPKYAITYEDKDGDWMLVGDVPWEMFISSCKRLRIMRGAEARGTRSSP
ncbi:auxin-induced protein 22D-like [Phoenix dactylifera]|uniref:Auxin-responsive protein n=1 Tax=Phoenix dactylifera TaxID=42345 RepID=A0A8B7BV92_PHODC|nr:auxin-induced protein 22D-like [Phoenix dactylifera]